MTAIDETMGRVFLRIIETASSVGMLARFCWVAGKRQCRPCAMKRLESQPVVSFVFGDTQQSCGERTGDGTSTRHVGRLPYPIERIKPLLLRAVALGEIERPHIRKFCDDGAFGGQQTAC